MRAACRPPRERRLARPHRLPVRRAPRGAAWALALAATAAPAAGQGAGPVSGVLAATLGAGAATGAERAAWDGTAAAFEPGTAGILLHAHRPFGMGELAVLEAGAWRDGRRLGLAAAWTQVEVEELYLGQGWELRAACRLGREERGPAGKWVAGAALAWERRTAAGRPAEEAWRQGYGLTWRPSSRIALGLMAREIPLGRGLAGDWEDQGMSWQWGMEAGSGPAAPGRARKAQGSGMGQTLRFDLRKTGAAPWRTLAAWSLRPHPSVEATAGLSSAPFQFSLGLRAAWAGWSFHHALRHHRHLGASRLSTLAWSTGPGD